MPAVPWRPLVVAVVAAVVGMALLYLARLVRVESVVVAFAVVLLGSALVAAYRRSSVLGVANGITLARLVGLGWLAGLTVSMVGSVLAPAAMATLLAVGTGCLVLDGIDGRVARARGEEGAFGARFDLETDAAMIMVLCCAVGLQGSVGPWVLLIGLLRYAYWLASLAVARLRIVLPPSQLRKTVAVVQAAALLICLFLGALALGPAWLPSVVAGIALAGLLWSFGSVTITQLRTR